MTLQVSWATIEMQQKMGSFCERRWEMERRNLWWEEGSHHHLFERRKLLTEEGTMQRTPECRLREIQETKLQTPLEDAEMLHDVLECLTV
jgi:hypothetical protein